EDASGAWSATDGRIVLRVGFDPAPQPDAPADAPRRLRLRANTVRPVAIRRCAVELRISCAEPPHFLDRYLRWRDLRQRATLNACTPFVLRWRDGHRRRRELRAARGFPAVHLDWRSGTARLMVDLDAAALHPRWSFRDRQTTSLAAPERDGTWCAEVGLLWRPVAPEESDVPAIAGRFPWGREAALTITDHPDFDTTDAFRLFLDGEPGHRGWLGRGLRMTKSVFVIKSASVPRPPAPTLADRDYLALVERLHGEGSEIAPHGVNESGNIPPDQFRVALAHIAARFRPRTWIDHGLTLHYCYSMGGVTNPEYALLDRLREHGMTTLWAYHDIPANAADSLNLLAPARRDLHTVFRLTARHLARGEVLTAAHYLRSGVVARLTGPLGHAAGRALATGRHTYMAHRSADARWHTAARLAAGRATSTLFRTAAAARNDARVAPRTPYTRAEAIDMAPSVYPERAVPLGQVRDDDLLLFSTLEVLHTTDALTPAAIARLIDERGVHIAHTYLLNRLPYIAGIFATPAAPGGRRLARAWVDALEALTAEVSRGRVWNPTMGELAEWLRALQRIAVRPAGRCTIELDNPMDRTVHGYSLLLPPEAHVGDIRWGDAAPAGTRRWHDWLCVWGDVPAHATIAVRWGADRDLAFVERDA
ncbi:MAG: hypothetical protein IRY91_10760, partial [Gemmatimonadaceae bacterium]|nr:hypothetical protein [Gemmatimonadaceae bacterium]